jgi:hypothetical protein
MVKVCGIFLQLFVVNTPDRVVHCCVPSKNDPASQYLDVNGHLVAMKMYYFIFFKLTSDNFDKE